VLLAQVGQDRLAREVALEPFAETVGLLEHLEEAGRGISRTSVGSAAATAEDPCGVPARNDRKPNTACSVSSRCPSGWSSSHAPAHDHPQGLGRVAAAVDQPALGVLDDPAGFREQVELAVGEPVEQVDPLEVLEQASASSPFALLGVHQGGGGLAQEAASGVDAAVEDLEGQPADDRAGDEGPV
jgi:hypothetical protein